MRISLIVAHDKNKAIGKNGQLPWHLPNDLQWFKKKTLNGIIVMGRNTWEGLSLKPLPSRTNLVMTNQENYRAKGAVVCHSVNDVLTIAMAKQAKEVFIIGGGEIYKLFYPLADTLLVTEVNTEVPNADTFFVDYPKKQWHQIFKEQHQADAKHTYDYTFTMYQKVISD